jgi:hypothetical protein
MKVYLTEEAKQEIEAKIAELAELATSKETMSISYIAQHSVYSLILQSATILPVEESWGKADEKSDYGLSSKEFYPQGVIIQPKKLENE